MREVGSIVKIHIDLVDGNEDWNWSELSAISPIQPCVILDVDPTDPMRDVFRGRRGWVGWNYGVKCMWR